MKTKEKYIIIISAFFSAILIIVFCFYVIKYFKVASGDKSNILYTAKINDATNYQVSIIENPYIEENILYADKAYITDLIKNITINYKYHYDINNSSSINYKYIIVASIVGNYDEGLAKPIWTKDYNLLNKYNLSSKNNLNIEEKIDIDLNQYNNIVNEFKNEFNINSIINLEVKLIIDFNNTLNNKTIPKTHIITINIPLNVKAFDITHTKNFAEEETEYIKEAPAKETVFVKLIIFISLIITVVALFIFLLKNILNKYKSPYILERNKILKDYDDRIIEVTNFVKYTKWETIEVKDIKELMELSNEAFEPVFFWEKKVNHKKEAWFCILRDSVLYKYVLTNNKASE